MSVEGLYNLSRIDRVPIIQNRDNLPFSMLVDIEKL